ncbi:12254_t:CDS:2 [Rhizophagus irregularis]|nr:12254_t:CDS:2 [Rhizophagus irregularis]
MRKTYEKFINLRYVNNKWKLLVSVVINDEFSQKLKKDFEFMLSLEYLCKGRVIYWRLPTSHYYNAHEERNDGCIFVKGFWYENQEIKRIKINASIIFRMLEGEEDFWESFKRRNVSVTRMLKLEMLYV